MQSSLNSRPPGHSHLGSLVLRMKLALSSLFPRVTVLFRQVGMWGKPSDILRTELREAGYSEEIEPKECHMRSNDRGEPEVHGPQMGCKQSLCMSMDGARQQGPILPT